MSDSSFAQRRYIFDLCAKLGKKPIEGYRYFSMLEASAAIYELKKEIFKKENSESDSE